MTTDPVAAELARLTPSSGRLDRDALLFAAGQAAGRTGPGWKLATGLLALSNAGLAIAWAMTPTPAPATVVVEVPAPMPVPAPLVIPPTETASPPTDTVRLTRLPFAPEGADPSSYAALLRTWSHPRPWAGLPPPPRPTLTAGSDPRFLGLN